MFLLFYVQCFLNSAKLITLKTNSAANNFFIIIIISVPLLRAGYGVSLTVLVLKTQLLKKKLNNKYAHSVCSADIQHILCIYSSEYE